MGEELVLSLLSLTEHASAGHGCHILGLEMSLDSSDGVVRIAGGSSDHLDDWRRNADTALIPWPGDGPGLVHRGFLAAALSVYRQASRGLLGVRRVELAGHSLGGAWATLLALMLAEDGFPVATVETYGCPRVGDREFCQSYPIRHVRYVCGRDPIPYLPWYRYHDLGPPIRLPSQIGWQKALPWRWPHDHRLFSYRAAMAQEGLLK
jgi:pimeloyl-ACP methyl ester carboxylesterase